MFSFIRVTVVVVSLHCSKILRHNLRSVDVCGLCHCLEPCYCLWAVLPQEDMLMSVFHLWYVLALEGILPSVTCVIPEAMLMFLVCTAADG